MIRRLGWDMAVGFLTLAALMQPLTAQAIVKVGSAESINVAIKYGIKKKDAGFAGILGPNWIEGQDGTLLNIYTPFMMIATQASKKGVETYSDKDVQLVRKRMTRLLSQLQDVHTPQEVKFSVALYGDRPNFGTQYTATLEGEGRGRSVSLKPVRVLPDKVANTNPDATVFEAINAYYFNFSELENLETMRLIIKSPQDEKVFSVNLDDIY